MKTFKKMTAMLLCLSMILSMTACSGGKSGESSSNGSTKDTTFSWWIFKGEDSSYYTDYRKNPAINYLLSKSWGSENKTIDLEFMIPAAGSEKDNCVTLIATGEYPDIMDLSVYPGSITELYQDGIALDITEYVEKYMPNYRAFLDNNPDLKATAMNVVDGQKKYLGIYDYQEPGAEMWGGYVYRRDWIIKYGTNPTDGSAFKGAYAEMNDDGTPNPDTWEDNIVFPSGGSDPVYISDWEWMLEIFQKAIKDQEISDGYPMSLYYPGYFELGDLVCGFGGGGAGWYKTPEGKIELGFSSDNFRTYLQCMNTWYKNGWIDTAFPEHATDMFYAIDDTKVRSGKVGLWYGLRDQFGGRLDNGDGLLDGIVVFAASQPINDIYGSAETQNVEPYSYYVPSQEGPMIMITDKAKDKDLPTFFAFLDHMYSIDGSLIKTMGLSKEQYETTKDSLYTEYELTDGAYVQNEDGTYQLVEKVSKDGGTLAAAIKANRIPGVLLTKSVATGNTEVRQHNLDLIRKYVVTGVLSNSFLSQLSVEDSTSLNKVQTNLREFATKNIPGFIQGTKDPYNDADWNAYIKALGKYNPDSVTQILQNLYDSLK